MFDGPWYDPLCIFTDCNEEEPNMPVVNNPGEVEFESGTSLHILELHGPTMGYGTGALLLLFIVATGAVAAYRWRRQRLRRRFEEEEIRAQRRLRESRIEAAPWMEAGPTTGWTADLGRERRWSGQADLGRERRWSGQPSMLPPAQLPPQPHPQLHPDFCTTSPLPSAPPAAYREAMVRDEELLAILRNLMKRAREAPRTNRLQDGRNGEEETNCLDEAIIGNQ